MPPEYLAALRVFAFQDSVSFAGYVRGMVHDHILERGAAFRTHAFSISELDALLIISSLLLACASEKLNQQVQSYAAGRT